MFNKKTYVHIQIKEGHREIYNTLLIVIITGKGGGAGGNGVH